MSSTGRELPPLALYVHLPWCIRKCPYCDFNSHVHDGPPPEAAYIERLLADLEADAALAAGRPLRSVFIGGGTPSLFGAASIAALLAGIEARLPLAAGAEITLEANPGSAEAAKFRALRAAGVNRLSIGVQSFDGTCLARLGRVHDAAEAHAAIDAAVAAGFTNFNIDLMHGLPGQTRALALADLGAAIAHGAPHLSWYQLTIEANTVFHRTPPELPDEDTLAAIQAEGSALLAAGGFDQYEVSAWSRPGHRSRHNLNYWRFGDYLGIGAGAHGKLTGIDGAVLRTQKTRLPRDYLAQPAGSTGTRTPVPAAELPFEFLLNALRLREGVEAADFERRTGVPLHRLAGPLRELRARGLLVEDERMLRTTELGFRFLDDVLAAIPTELAGA